MGKLTTLPFLSCFFLIGIFCTIGCVHQDELQVYQKSESIPDYEWSYDFQPTFSFEIEDTTAHYDLYVTLRHTNKYPFNNLWLFIHSAYEGVKPTTKRVELPLAEASGKWLGAGMNDIYEHRIPIQQNIRFENAGTYHISLEQNMRVNPLPYIMAVGIRVEKTTP